MMAIVMDQVALLFVVGSVVVAGSIALLAWQISKRRAARRSEALRRESLMTGFVFSPQVIRLGKNDASALDAQLSEPLKSMQVFQKGRNVRIWNLMRRDEKSGKGEWIFDFSFVTGSGNNRQTVRQTFLICCLRQVSFPSFVLQPEGFFSRLFDGADIDFEQDDEFSKRFLLKGKDVQQIRMLFTPSLRSFLREKKDWTVEAGGPWVAFCRRGRLISPEDLLTVQGEFNQLLDIMTSQLR